jgi:hypothetical protein
MPYNNRFIYEDERHAIVATCMGCLTRLPFPEAIDKASLQSELDTHLSRCRPVNRKVFVGLFVLLLVVISLAGYMGWL